MATKIFCSFLLLLASASAKTDLCVQGCCELEAGTDISSLKFIADASSLSTASQKVFNLDNPSIKCCPCPDVKPIQEQKFIKQAANAIGFDFCPPGICENWCECTDDFAPPVRKPLRPICPQGICNTKSCICREEVLLGIRNVLFDESAGEKSDEKQNKTWNILSGILGNGGDEKKAPIAGKKEEL